MDFKILAKDLEKICSWIPFQMNLNTQMRVYIYIYIYIWGLLFIVNPETCPIDCPSRHSSRQLHGPSRNHGFRETLKFGHLRKLQMHRNCSLHCTCSLPQYAPTLTRLLQLTNLLHVSFTDASQVSAIICRKRPGMEVRRVAQLRNWKEFKFPSRHSSRNLHGPSRTRCFYNYFTGSFTVPSRTFTNACFLKSFTHSFTESFTEPSRTFTNACVLKNTRINAWRI